MDLISELSSRRLMLQELNYSEANIIDNLKEYIYNNGTYSNSEINEIVQNFYIASDIEVDPHLFNNGQSEVDEKTEIINDLYNSLRHLIRHGLFRVANNGTIMVMLNDNNYQEFEDVKVVLDQEQLKKIENKVLENSLDKNCCICLDELKKDDIVNELICKHIFHKDCIQPYLEDYHYLCPLCKKPAGEGIAKIENQELDDEAIDNQE
jgi:hypothetical protein